MCVSLGGLGCVSDHIYRRLGEFYERAHLPHIARGRPEKGTATGGEIPATLIVDGHLGGSDIHVGHAASSGVRAAWAARSWCVTEV